MLSTWVKRQGEINELVWGEPNCVERKYRKVFKAWNFQRKEKKKSFWWHQQNRHLFFSWCTVVITRGLQGSLGSSSSGSLYPFLQEGCTTQLEKKMEISHVSTGILRTETLRCWDVHAGGLMGCVLRNNYERVREAGRVEKREKTKWSSVPIAASANHSKSSKGCKSSKGILIEARSPGFCTVHVTNHWLWAAPNSEQSSLPHQRAMLSEGCNLEPSATNNANHLEMSS